MMTAINWQTAIALTILGGFFTSFFLLRSLKVTLLIGFAVTGFWILWSLGLSSPFVGYSLYGPLLTRQLFLIVGVTAASVGFLYVIHRLIGENRQLRRENQILHESFKELQFLNPDIPTLEDVELIEHIKGVEDHRKKLFQFIERSEERLVILSGWVTDYACNEDLISTLERALKRGVKIYVGWGFKSKVEERQKTPLNKGEKTLVHFRNYNPGRVYLAYFKNHAKLLMTRDRCIIGGFNWLSNVQGRNEEISAIIENRNFIENLWRTISYFWRKKPDTSS